MDEEGKEPGVVELHSEPEEYVEAETAFLRAVGLCITQWAFIDRQLFRLFRQGVGAPTHRAAVVYYDQHSINSHLRQVDALLKGLLEAPKHENLRELWTEVRAGIVELLPARNVIAHQPVRAVHKTEGDKRVTELGIYIEPYQRFLNKKHKGMQGKDALGTNELIAHSEAVEELHMKLFSFTKMIVRTFRGR